MIAHIYRPDTACNTDGGYAGCLETGVFRGTGGEAMQDLGYELPRIHILRRWVNKGKKGKGGGLASPTISAQALSGSLSDSLGTPPRLKTRRH
jgi:hypothetical protein